MPTSFPRLVANLPRQGWIGRTARAGFAIALRAVI
jgi:hypothetical protein